MLQLIDISGLAVSRGDAILTVDRNFLSIITVHHWHKSFLSSRLLGVFYVAAAGAASPFTNDGFVEQSWDISFNILALGLAKRYILTLKYQNNNNDFG